MNRQQAQRIKPQRQSSEWSPAKQQLLGQRLQSALDPNAAAQTIPCRPDQGPAPLSYAQERMWFLNQWQSSDPAHNRPFALRLVGQLDIAALERTLAEIVRRHEVLRARFVEENGQLRQSAVPSEALHLPVTDFSHWPWDRRLSEAKRWVAEKAGRPFDLGRDSLFSAALLKLDDGDHALVAAVHHTAFDAWSASIFRREMEGAPPTLELPADQPRLQVQTYRGDSAGIALPELLVEAPTALSQGEGATLFMILPAAFKILLYQLDGLLEFLGRLDDHIKMRGARVEPGEVTATLSSYPGAEDSIVDARKNKRGYACLAAYVAVAGDRSPTVNQRMTYLRMRHVPALLDWLKPSRRSAVPVPTSKWHRGRLGRRRTVKTCLRTSDDSTPI